MQRWALICVLALVAALPCVAEETITMKGTVLDVDGDPVGGVKVFAVKRWVTEDYHVGVKAAAVSGEDGRFVLKPLPKPEHEKFYFLVAFVPDEYLGWSWRMIGHDASAEEDVAITVSKCRAVEGHVTDEEGNPLAGATVQHHYFNRRDRQSFFGRSSRARQELEAVVRFTAATTDSEGNYSLTSVPQHVDVSPHATKPGYYHQRAAPQSPGDVVTMVRAGNVAGRLVDKRGKGMSGITMHAREVRGGGYATAQTGADGSFTLADLPPGKFSVWIGARETMTAKAVQNVHVRVGETTRVADMLASRGVFISGRLLDADTDKPISDMRVAATVAGHIIAGERVDQAGRYKLRVAPEDTYTVYCQGGNPSYPYDREASRTVEVFSKELRNIDIRLRKAAVATGKIVDEQGRPVPGASVSVWSGMMPVSARSDAKGVFEIAVPEQTQGFG